MEISVDVNQHRQQSFQISPSNIFHRNSPRRIIQNRERNDNLLKNELYHCKQYNKMIETELKKENKRINILCFIVSILSLTIIGIVLYFYFFHDKEYSDIEKYLNVDDSKTKYISENQIRIIFDNFINKTHTWQKSLFRYPRIEYIIHDTMYVLPKLELIEKFAKKNEYDKTEYKLNKNDCDNYSFILYGDFLKLMYNYNLTSVFLFGVGYLSRLNEDQNNYYTHTQNVFIDDKYDIYCVESQTDVILFCNESIYNIYSLIF